MNPHSAIPVLTVMNFHHRAARGLLGGRWPTLCRISQSLWRHRISSASKL